MTTRRPLTGENRFYLFAGAYVLLVGLLGFARNFYLLPFGVEPLPNSGPIYPGVILHGALLTAWMVLAVWQPWLIATGRQALHRKTGKWAAVLAVLIITSGIYVGVVQAQRFALVVQGWPGFFALPLVIMTCFGVSLALAIAFRNKPRWHKGWIVIAHCHLLEPAAARALQTLNLQIFPAILLVISLPLLVGIVWDAVTHRRVPWMFIGGFIFVQAAGFFRHALAPDPQWNALVAQMVAP